MRVFIMLAAIMAAECVEHHKLDAESMQQKWKTYKENHNLAFDGIEEKLRFTIFFNNVELIERHNQQYEAGVHTYHLGLNQFAHMTNDEYGKLLGSKYDKTASKYQSVSTYKAPVGETLPKSWDWREKGAVTPVKDQGKCKADWIFSGVQALESYHLIKTGELVALSVQQIIDCFYINDNCDGHFVYGSVLFYIVENFGGIMTEQSYPFVAHQQHECKFNNKSIAATFNGLMGLFNEQLLADALVNYGPISVAVDTTTSTFRFYKSGVYSDILCGINGARNYLLLVGYGIEDGKDYWLLKNCWGLNWGEEGYIKLLSGEQICRIGESCYFPV